MSVKWIKITTDMFNNKKIKQIRKLPSGNNIVLIWIMLIVQAGQANKEGGLFITDTMPFTDEQLSIEFDFDISVIRLALSALEKFEMIAIYDDIIFIKNWNEYQNIEGLEKIREQNKLRAAEYRKRKKQLTINGPKITSHHVTHSMTVTQRHETERELELELDKEKEIKEKEIYKEKEIEDVTPYQQIFDLYNSIVTKLRKCERLTQSRKDLIKKRWIEYPDISHFDRLFKRANASRFLTGDNTKGWIATFDWMLGYSKTGADNMLDVLERKYSKNP